MKKVSSTTTNKVKSRKDYYLFKWNKSWQLPDGTKINVRSHSKAGRVTLEIQGKGKHKIKIRYK